jgi:hypothetical protein
MFICETPPSSAECNHVSTEIGPPLAANPVYFAPLCRDASSPDDDVSRHAVLILSADPLAAALLGAAVELAGHVPHFVRQGEPARDALLRVRPRLVLVDCDHDESCTDEFVGPALMTGARVMLFRSRRTERDRTAFASRLSLRVVEMPAEHEVLKSVLLEMLSD